MKKKILIIAFVLVLVMLLVASIFIYKSKKEKEEQARYVEIKESVKKAVEWNLSAQYPFCKISKDFKETSFPGAFYNSKFLINNGYIKKEELLDVDGESYCDVYVDINTYYEDPLDQQKNCELYYKIYLKCNNYKDKGYINWG